MQSLNGCETLSSERSLHDHEDERSSRLRDIEQDTEDILLALSSQPPEDIEPTLPSDGSLRIPPSMQFEMRLSTIEEASVISGSLPCDDDTDIDNDNEDIDENDDDEETLTSDGADDENEQELDHDQKAVSGFV